MNQNKNVLQSFINMIIILVSCFTLTSCQGQTKLTIYMEPNINENRIAEIEIEGGKYKSVLEEYEKMLLQVPEDSLGAADIFNNLGGIYAEYEEDKEKAEYYLNKAIKIHKQKNNDVGLAADYTEMSKIYIYIGGKAEEGIKYLEQAEEIYRRLGLDNSFGLAGVMINKGHLYMKETFYEEALEAYKNAEEIYKNRQKDNAYNNLFIGKIYEKMQKYEEAKEQYIAGQNLSEQENNQYLVAEFHYQLGGIFEYTEDYNNAIDEYLQSLKYFETDEYYLFKTAGIYNSLTVSYYKTEKPKKALDASIKAYNLIITIKPVTKDIKEKTELCKKNMKKCYQTWSSDVSEDGFNKWFDVNVKVSN